MSVLVSPCQGRSTLEMSRVYSCLIGKPVDGHFLLRTLNIKIFWCWFLAQSGSLDKNPLMTGVYMHGCLGDGAGMMVR